MIRALADFDDLWIGERPSKREGKQIFPSATGEQHRNEGISLTVKGKKGELNMAEQENPQCHFCMGLLIGGALGTLAGIFFALKSGKELRSDIKDIQEI
jgi:hypothetical protein